MSITAKAAATSLGVLAGLAMAATPATATGTAGPAPEQPSVQGCGFTGAVPPWQPTWENCSGASHRIVVVYFNSAGPPPSTGETVTCVQPGVTNLVDATNGVGWPISARVLDSQPC